MGVIIPDSTDLGFDFECSANGWLSLADLMVDPISDLLDDVLYGRFFLKGGLPSSVSRDGLSDGMAIGRRWSLVMLKGVLSDMFLLDDRLLFD
jgi:hypothetical protein